MKIKKRKEKLTLKMKKCQTEEEKEKNYLQNIWKLSLQKKNFVKSFN